jgi:hypothetical protein
VADEVGPEAVRPIDSEKWHLVDALDPITLCGKVIQYGSRRKLWAETHPDDRCLLCLRQLGV